MEAENNACTVFERQRGGRQWHWIAKGNVKGCREALICSAQEHALRTNYTKFYIDKSSESPICRMRGEKAEPISHLVSECSKLAQTRV